MWPVYIALLIMFISHTVLMEHMSGDCLNKYCNYVPYSPSMETPSKELSDMFDRLFNGINNPVVWRSAAIAAAACVTMFFIGMRHLRGEIFPPLLMVIAFLLVATIFYVSLHRMSEVNWAYYAEYADKFELFKQCLPLDRIVRKRLSKSPKA